MEGRRGRGGKMDMTSILDELSRIIWADCKVDTISSKIIAEMSQVSEIGFDTMTYTFAEADIVCGAKVADRLQSYFPDVIIKLEGNKLHLDWS
jgi:hypothetical protein